MTIHKSTKKKKLSFSTIALIVIVGLLVFFEVKSWLTREKIDIFSRVMLSDKGYAKKIDIKSYILTNSQVKEFFNDPNKEPKLLTYRQLLSNDKKSLILCIKNLGAAPICGTLSYCFDGYHWWNIDIPDLGRKNETLIYVIPLGPCGLGDLNDDLPKIKTKWKHLYNSN